MPGKVAMGRGAVLTVTVGGGVGSRSMGPVMSAGPHLGPVGADGLQIRDKMKQQQSSHREHHKENPDTTGGQAGSLLRMAKHTMAVALARGIDMY